jgi:hypothetical protein
MKRFNTQSVVGGTAFRNLHVSVLSLMLFTLLSMSAANAAELVINGGFEQPVIDSTPGWSTFYGENHPLTEPPDCPDSGIGHEHCNDDIRIPGWFVYWTDDLQHYQQLNAGRLEIQRGTIDDVCACDGSFQKAELDSHHRQGNDNNNTTIGQLLPTCPRTAYKLTYGWKSRTTVPGDNDVRVIVGDTLVNMHAQNLDWEIEEVHFVTDDSYETLLLFGSIGTATTLGMYLDEVSVTGPDGSDSEPCTLVCDDKPMELTLMYDGDDDSSHQQTGSEVIIYPEVVDSYPTDAVIKVFGHNKRKPKLLGTFDVSIGDLFSVSGPHKRIPARLVFAIYHPDDLETAIQTITFHTSCSQPMDAGDEFGAISVWSAIN